MTIDGVAQGSLPLPDSLYAEPGPLGIRVEAAGYVMVSRSVEVTVGAVVHETIAMERASRGSPSGIDPLTIAGLVLAGVGVAGVGMGVGFFGERERNAGIWNDDSQCLIGSMTRGESCAAFAGAAQDNETAAILMMTLVL